MKPTRRLVVDGFGAERTEAVSRIALDPEEEEVHELDFGEDRVSLICPECDRLLVGYRSDVRPRCPQCGRSSKQLGLI